MSESLTLALSKGRIFQETLPLLEALDIRPAEDPESSRKLLLATNRPELNLLIVRAADVPTYVQYGGADLGVAGKDVLLEYGGEGLYEPVDLGIARCRLMVAGFPEGTRQRSRLRIATKYVNTTRRHFASKGQQIEIIKLYGSMELAPIVGMADCIVDVVDTGNTLKANGLVPLETIATISSRLVVNRASLKTQHATLGRLLEQLSQVVAARESAHSA
jgi:ATP phosphoribosyltransferase